jgi:hypothetical protein
MVKNAKWSKKAKSPIQSQKKMKRGDNCVPTLIVQIAQARGQTRAALALTRQRVIWHVGQELRIPHIRTVASRWRRQVFHGW